MRVPTVGAASESRPPFGTFQWIIITLIEQSDAVSAIPRITNLHIDSKQPRGRKFFDCESNRLGGRSEATVPETSSSKASSEKEFRGSRVIKLLFRALNLFGRSIRVCLMVRATANFTFILF